MTGTISNRIAAIRQFDIFTPDCSRVITRHFRPGGEERTRNAINRILSLDDGAAEREWEKTANGFRNRHRDFEDTLRRNYDRHLSHFAGDAGKPAGTRKLLLAAYFTMEYAVEAAGLFNPSIVPHFDQSGAPAGCVRVILSLRATGEGHISSIVFRTGTVDSNGRLAIDRPGRFIETPDARTDALYEKKLFRAKLRELGAINAAAGDILGRLPDQFPMDRLLDEIEASETSGRYPDNEMRYAREAMEWLADSNYEMCFAPGRGISERVVFPISANEKNGIEDARFVRFAGENGSPRYYATYTAFNGTRIMPQLIETTDFNRFKMSSLNGPAAIDKGMALFPRKIGGLYAMIGRLDGVNLYLMYSEHPHFWYEGRIILRPQHPWELVQTGNCGSPAETGEGWLLLTHGVGPMRQYSIGAALLDLDDPSKVLGRLEEPLLVPGESEREGYVPNVVYTCGFMIHNGHVVIPYSITDQRSAVASVPLRDILNRLKS